MRRRRRPARPRMCVVSGCEASGVAREGGDLADVGEVEVEHDDALEADAAASVREGAELEGIGVGLDRVGVRASVAGAVVAVGDAVDKEFVVVDALRSRDDLLAAHEHVERVGQVLGGRTGGIAVRRGVGHRVEGADRQRVLVHDEEVGAVLSLDEVAEDFLVFGREVVEGALLRLGDAGLAEQRDALGEREAEGARFEVLERFERVGLRDDLELVLEVGLDRREDVREEPREHVEDLVVVLVDGHLHVEPGELAEMAPRVGVFGAEDGADLVDALEVRARGEHLLVQLRRLRETGRLAEVLESKHRTAALRGAAE
mmetsp:Transcript_5902/g.24712  ORF Transcript_5902/g.24712 Transcript_5902/m.24712 type:complete len:316 (+) Transcript_5902:337-1284(+)